MFKFQVLIDGVPHTVEIKSDCQMMPSSSSSLPSSAPSSSSGLPSSSSSSSSSSSAPSSSSGLPSSSASSSSSQSSSSQPSSSNPPVGRRTITPDDLEFEGAVIIRNQGATNWTLGGFHMKRNSEGELVILSPLTMPFTNTASLLRECKITQWSNPGDVWSEVPQVYTIEDSIIQTSLRPNGGWEGSDFATLEAIGRPDIVWISNRGAYTTDPNWLNGNMPFIDEIDLKTKKQSDSSMLVQTVIQFRINCFLPEFPSCQMN